MYNLNKKLIPYSLIMVEILLLFISMITRSILSIIISAILAFTIFIIYHSWDILESLIFKHTNLIQIIRDYEINGDRNTAIFYIGNDYGSISVAKVYNISGDGIDTIKFEKLIEKVNIPFKIVTQIEKIQTKNIIENIETRKYMKEIAFSKISGKSPKDRLKMEKLKNELSYLEHEISELYSGGTPLRISYYIMCAATSSDRYTAEKCSLINLNQVTIEFDSSFGTKSKLLNGSELVNTLRLESMIL